jgi:hypothetical protein
MNAKTTKTFELSYDEIIIGKYTLSDIIIKVHKSVTQVVKDLSLIENRDDVIGDIDVPLYDVLNLLEDLEKTN